MKAFLFFITLFSTFSVFAQSDDGVKILSAKWGTKSVTTEAGTFCDHKERCDYKVSERYIGIAGGASKTFEVSWLCHGRKSTTVSKKLPANAEGQIVSIDCSQVNHEDDIPSKPIALPKSKPGLNPQTVAYYRALLVRFKSNPDSVKMEDLNKTFYPMEAAPAGLLDRLLSCTLSNGGSDCDPDTYYSWGPQEKMLAIKNATTIQNWGSDINGGRSVYMNQSAVGSYCYGPVPVRIKFLQTPQRGQLNDGTFKSTFNEWTTEDSRYISSVSYAQPEHIDEMIIEIQRRMDDSQKWQSAALYVYSTGRSLKEKVYKGCVPERMEETEQNLVANVMGTIEAYFNGKGWVHSQACENNCSSTTHFTTKWKSFFNPS